MRTYKVKVDQREVPVEAARVSAMPFNKVFDGTQRPLSQTEEAYFVTVDMAEPIRMEITVEEGFTDYELRPAALGLRGERDGNRVTLTVDRPMQFTLEPDGYHEPLHIFVNPPAAEPEGGCRRFEKGEHDAGLIWLRSGDTLYLDEGAVVHGVVYAKDAEHVRILGRGVLDASRYRRSDDLSSPGGEILEALAERGLSPADRRYAGNLVLNHCRDVLVEGVILRDAPLWSLIARNNCEDITIDNVKIVGQWRYNSDGIDICTSRNVTVKNSFVRSFDDCFVARGAYLEGEEGDVENVLVENCVFWCDWGKSLEIWCGQKPTAIRNVVFNKNYLIRLNYSAVNITTWYGSAGSLVENVTYRELFIEGDREYQSAELESEVSPVYVSKPGFLPLLVHLYAQKLGKMAGLGTQQVEACDLSQFHLRYSNIVFEDIHCDDPRLRARADEIENVLKIENVTVRNSSFALEWHRR